MLLSNGTEISTFLCLVEKWLIEIVTDGGINTMKRPLQLGICSMVAPHRSRVHCQRKVRTLETTTLVVPKGLIHSPPSKKVGQRLFNVQTIRLRRSSIRQLRLSIFAGFKQSGISFFTLTGLQGQKIDDGLSRRRRRRWRPPIPFDRSVLGGRRGRHLPGSHGPAR